MTPHAVEQFIEACERDGIHIRPIAVDYASHSAQVEALREQLLAELAGLTPQPAAHPAVFHGGQRAIGRSAGHHHHGRRVLVCQPA